ncbi:MAG: DUF4338 domain-containing protein [Acidobacteria bacterium]|nr:DUF4338 domain-containing protein [Acidobacteriota bacterium]
MVQSVELNPALRTLLPLFRERCAAIQKRQDSGQGALVTAEFVNELRRTHLTPLVSPNRAELAEELNLLATLSIVVDLITQGWRITSTEQAVVLEFPECESTEAEKDRIRRAHLIEREAQIREPSVLEFVSSMEKRKLTPKGWHSIFSLMRDGEELASRLCEIGRFENPQTQAELLARTIRPYIQVVEADAVCEHTGLRLNDIWRYFRHTWVTSYKSVPGRTMMILVRDAAAPNHPVIGIASLASSVVQQSTRDSWIGWDADGVVELFRSAQKPKKCVQWLLSKLDGFIKAVYLKDLLRDNLLTRADLRRPSSEVIAKLLKDSDRAIRHHRLYPNAAMHKSSSGTSRNEWMERAETSLFRSKRSKQLATMLSIRQLFQKLGLSPEMPVTEWQTLLDSSRFRHAVGQIARMVKAERVGINMMDIAICGAVAPYNVLLGGKLVCLLLCSPEVVKEYKARYGEQTSLIASCMRGASVRRDAELVLLCTTSLYGSALNQYSRVKVPTVQVGGDPAEKIEYEWLGTSEGFGSFHFSKDTLRMLVTLLGRSKEARKVNSIFGEGVNPLMRKIREGLSMLGLPADVLLKHNSRRVVYGVPLAKNFREFLLGLSDSPRYLIPASRPKHRTELLAEYWRQRWLLKRLRKPGVLEQVARHTCVYPMRHGARVQLPRDSQEAMLDLWAADEARSE